MLVINCDILADLSIDDLLMSHIKNKCHCTIVTQSIKQTFDLDQYKISGQFTKIDEKPIINHFINAGIYIFDKCALKF